MEPEVLQLYFILMKMVVDCPMVITSIGDTLFQTRPGMRNWSRVKPIFCIIDTVSCLCLLSNCPRLTKSYHLRFHEPKYSQNVSSNEDPFLQLSFSSTLYFLLLVIIFSEVFFLFSQCSYS